MTPCWRLSYTGSLVASPTSMSTTTALVALLASLVSPKGLLRLSCNTCGSVGTTRQLALAGTAARGTGSNVTYSIAATRLRYQDGGGGQTGLRAFLENPSTSFHP